MKLLLAEDEKELSRAVETILTHTGYEVDVAFDGEEALALFYERAYDVIISDIMMPKLDGIELLENIRRQGDATPVLLLTAKAEIDDRVVGLEAGADDYLPKPFAMKELLARVQALARRVQGYSQPELKCGNVILQMDELRLTARNDVQLSLQEAALMRLLLLSSERPIKGRSIVEKLWADETEEDKVELYIAYLRDKLDSIGADIVIAEERDEDGTAFRLVKEE
ncbi:response regulator transcription factor [Selenomonas sp. TAMA-11512]|uniref:response regulator transcription factor n=1 Tax=Selenomonas sp. TAMA-11512 TaxID=3095337 RepID=UPI00308D9849|nr:response regulator transcription factor [Selenomonas sp. TAMA-11512]